MTVGAANAWARWSSWRRHDRATAVHAAILVGAAAILVRTMTIDRASMRLRHLAVLLRRRLPVQHESARVQGTRERHAVAVTVVAEAVAGRLGAGCLPTAMAVQALMARDGVAADLVIGARAQQRQFAAHAWVECDGQVLSASGPEGFEVLHRWPLSPAATGTSR